MDRIDIQLMVSRVDARMLVNRKPGQTSAEIAARVLKAREIQRARFAETGEDIFCNASMNNRQTEKYCPLSPDCKELLERLIERMGLSARACARIIRLARTIADLEGSEKVQSHHIAEAIGYRNLDRGDWAERGI